MMNLQYILDNTGKTTGVFIPISVWNELKIKFKDIDLEHIDIPNEQKEEVKRRLEDYKMNPEQAINFDEAIDSIEKNL